MSDEKSKVVDFKKFREESIERRKRQYERLMFSEFVNCYSVIDNQGSILAIEMLNISRTGCLIEVPVGKSGHLEPFITGNQIKLRLYFTKQSYIPVVGEVIRLVDSEKDGTQQYGLEFDQSLQSFQVLQSFIDFVSKFAEFSQTDTGLDTVYYI